MPKLVETGLLEEQRENWGSRAGFVLAAIGCHSLPVVRRPRVAILSTGDEIVQPGEAMRPGLVFDSNGRILAFAEDIGRHNALDKAVGTCLLQGGTAAGHGVALSGRVSLEMLSKCACAGIELIAAVSAPTTLAVRAAEQCNITLCCSVRDSEATAFTGLQRVQVG